MVKFIPVHDMQAYRESGGIAPHILNLGTTWRSVINLGKLDVSVIIESN